MTTASHVMNSSVSTDSWEQLVEDGRKMGQVHWLFQSEEGPMAGLWKIDTEEGAEIPYRVTTSFDSFHVIEGEGELETPDGEKIQLTAGGIYSFPNGFTATWRTRSPLLKFFVMA
jgi:uncharacterized cupin superfamily protein